MGGVEDCRWIDVMIDEIGFALTKADETIQKSIDFWKELTKDLLVHQAPKQLSNGKEEPIQHWAMRLSHAKEEPNQQWATCASKVPESLMLTQGNYDCYDNDCRCGEEEEEEEEEEDETTDSEDMWDLNLATTFSSSCYQDHNEDDNTGLELRGGYYKLLRDRETSSDESWDEEVEECYSESVKDMLGMKSMCDASTESLVCHGDEDDLSDTLQGYLNVSQEDIIANDVVHSEEETLFPDSDWVYVTRDLDL